MKWWIECVVGAYRELSKGERDSLPEPLKFVLEALELSILGKEAWYTKESPQTRILAYREGDGSSVSRGINLQ